MASKKDYYEVLGVGKDATPDDIKKAFREKARKYHPDVSKEPDAEERFKEANEAYAVLGDPEKRAAYDRYGHAGFGPGMPGGDPFAGGFVDFSDIFEELFGSSFRSAARASQRGPRRGADLSYRLTIEFEEAVFGTEREIEFTRTAGCETCGGNGSAPGTQPEKCTTCGGAGEVRQVRQSLFGQMVNITTCPQCYGRGTLITTPCPTCSGSGQVRANRKLTVSIPAGVDTGNQIRIAGEGEPGANGGPPGNLFIALTVKNHQFFTRKEYDLVIKARINVAQAALGHVLQVPVLTPEGQIEEPLNIPAGTQSGDVLVMKKKGVPKLRRDGTNTGYGDQHVVVEVTVPRKLTNDQRALFEKLGASLGEAVIPPASEKGFFEKVADWLGGE